MYAVPPHFVVIDGPAPVTTGDPFQAIKQFEQSTYPGVWPHVDKAQMLQDMSCRLRDPSTVMAGQTSVGEQHILSGGTAILFNLIRQNPFRYVRLCHSLFETGGFQTLRQRVQSSEHLRKSRVDEYWTHDDGQRSLIAQSIEHPPHLSPVDWMLLMTLYEAQLSSFPSPSFMPFMPKVIAEHQQLTKPWELKGWLTDIFGYRRVRYHHAHLQPGWSLLQKAKNTIRDGGVAIALVHAERLLRGLALDLPAKQPDSWVTLTDVAPTSWWNTVGQPTRTFSFTFHLGQALIPTHVKPAAFHQSCWGIMLAQP